MDDYLKSALAAFDTADMRPEAGQRPGLDALPDGDYDLEIVEAVADRTAKTGQPIYRLALKVLGGPLAGTVIERGSVLSTQENINRLLGDFQSLGLDSDRWGSSHGRPLPDELAKAGPKLVGVRFRGKKTHSDATDRNGLPKVYHNLYIQSRLNGSSVPAAPRPRSPGIPASEIPF